MNNTLRVGGIQRIGNLYPQLEELTCLQRLRGDVVLERLPFEQLHDNKELPAVLDGLVDTVNRADVRVIQCGGGARFPSEPLHRLKVFG